MVSQDDFGTPQHNQIMMKPAQNYGNINMMLRLIIKLQKVTRPFFQN